MKSAYLYVRVSTVEQKKAGYSLIEQEALLLLLCVINNIKVRGVFREDYSAKDFNRPEWKKLIKTFKKIEAILLKISCFLNGIVSAVISD